MKKPLDIVMLNKSTFQEWENGIVNRNFHILKHLLKRPEVGRIMAVDYLPYSLKKGLAQKAALGNNLIQSVLFDLKYFYV